MEHLPADCDAVARIDAQAVFASEGVRRHLQEHTHKRDPRLVEGVASFLQDSRLDVLRDVREVAICLADSATAEGNAARRAKYLVIIAGDLGQSDVLAGVLKHAPTERAFKKRGVKGKDVLERDGILLGQADDGAILISDSADLLTAARAAQQAHLQRLKLPAAPVAAVANREVLASFGSSDSRNSLGQALGATQRLQLTFELAPVRVNALLEAASEAEAARLRAYWEQVFAPFRNEALLRQLGSRLPPALVDMLKAAETAARGNQVLVKLPLPPSALESLYHTVAVLTTTEE